MITAECLTIVEIQINVIAFRLCKVYLKRFVWKITNSLLWCHSFFFQHNEAKKSEKPFSFFLKKEKRPKKPTQCLINMSWNHLTRADCNLQYKQFAFKINNITKILTTGSRLYSNLLTFCCVVYFNDSKRVTSRRRIERRIAHGICWPRNVNVWIIARPLVI